LIYAGRAGTGMAVATSLLSLPPSRDSKFGSPLVPSRIHRVGPEMLIEVSFAEWTPDGLLRHTVYLDERQDELPIEGDAIV
jgi:bifunctional non-homologous end joining protein LigD